MEIEGNGALSSLDIKIWEKITNLWNQPIVNQQSMAFSQILKVLLRVHQKFG